jgi:hypothetical protein
MSTLFLSSLAPILEASFCEDDLMLFCLIPSIFCSLELSNYGFQMMFVDIHNSGNNNNILCLFCVIMLIVYVYNPL